MKTSDFYFDLPEELIAQYPTGERGESRMMILDSVTGLTENSTISDLPDMLDKDTLVVMNNSRVRKARLYGESVNGGRVEFLLLEKRLDNCWLAMVSKAKKQKPGKCFSFPGGVTGEIAGIEEQYRIIRFNCDVDDTYLDREGHIPLPPYIKREDAPSDSERYQTVYSNPMGSVAAPTAGLHFTEKILREIETRTAGIVFVTLHVGLGTFLPVRTENITDHKMHTESYEISEDTAFAVNEAIAGGKKILAVGTTSVRTLESSFSNGRLRSGDGLTDIYIYPGYKFKVINQLLTNFHTPESSLLMLVSALAGRDKIMRAYMNAVDEKYRFFSYGDAMFIK